MKCIIFELEGPINRGARDLAKRREAAMQALSGCGIETTDDQFSDALRGMRLARAEDPIEAAMWQVFRAFSAETGMHDRVRSREWDRLISSYRGLAGYCFDLRHGMRALLEELKFNSVDSWGDIPTLVCVSNRGEQARDALEQAGVAALMTLVDVGKASAAQLCDPRRLTSLLEEVGVAPEQALVVACNLNGLGLAATMCGIPTIVLEQDDDFWGPPARTRREEPLDTVSTVHELGDLLADFVNIGQHNRAVQ